VVSKISILITTRNRAAFLSNLLESISLNTRSANQIIVVSSGCLIDDVVKLYRDSFKWEFYHLDEVGQSAQKKFGISKINVTSEWIIFLDDDVTVGVNFIEDIESRIRRFEFDSVVGVGFRLTSYSKQNLGIKSKFLTSILSLTGLHGFASQMGIFLPYRFSSKKIQVKWLNGLSMWRKDTLNLYELPFYNSKYAALEDVIFAQKARQLGKLVYEPNIALHDQNLFVTQNMDLMQLKYYSLWKFWTLKKCSKFIFFVAFLIHAIHCMKLVFTGSNSYLSSVKLLMDLLKYQFKVLGIYMLNRRVFVSRIVELLRIL
jgi:glycosyltransferase involved in cell wall biosynthesis